LFVEFLYLPWALEAKPWFGSLKPCMILPGEAPKRGEIMRLLTSVA
jgi:hypothetical protein